MCRLVTRVAESAAFPGDGRCSLEGTTRRSSRKPKGQAKAEAAYRASRKARALAARSRSQLAAPETARASLARNG